MLLEHTTMRQLSGWLKPHMGEAAWPGLDGANAPRRARQWMKRLGLWEGLGKRIEPGRPIEVIRRSVYRAYARTGLREGHGHKTFFIAAAVLISAVSQDEVIVLKFDNARESQDPVGLKQYLASFNQGP